MNRILRQSCIVLSLLAISCGEETGSSTSDCRADSMECPDGQRCVTDSDGRSVCMDDPLDMRIGTDDGGPRLDGGPQSMPDAGPSLPDMTAEPPPRDARLDVEQRQLRIPFDDPMDPRTISTVLGVRSVRSINETQIEMQIGPSFNVPEASDPQGYHVYSPDDPSYPLEALTEPVRVELSSESETAEAAPDSQGRTFERHVVTLTVNIPLRDGARYFVRAIGGRRTAEDPMNHHRTPWEGYPLTAGRNAGQFVHGEDNDEGEVDDTLIDAVMGARMISVVGPNHIRLDLGPGTHADALDDPNRFVITSFDDSEYADGHNPTSVGRRSFPEVFVPGYGYPFPRKLNRHEVYLTLSTPLTEGMTYTVATLDGLTSGRASVSVTYSDDAVHNLHLKVNQIGYRPDAPIKLGLLGAWMGTLGTLDYGSDERDCVVMNAETGEEALRVPLTFRHAADAADEGPYQNNFTQEDLHQCDFTALRTPGTYYLKIAGMGRSVDFDIADDVYLDPFITTMRGLFYQRSGQSIDETNSAYRRVASHLDPVDVPYGENRTVVGGHYDAGDYNPRGHYDVVHILFLAYETFPRKFTDGQLDVPERGNGIPDIVDEAMWGLQALLALQDDDGGVGFDAERGHFIESKADPNFVEVAERDPWIQETYEKHPQGTLIMAALAATASRIHLSIGQDDQASRLLDAAERAYAWAQMNGAEAHVDESAWAAAELAKTTGESRFITDFSNSGYTLLGVFDDGNITRLRPALSFALDTSGRLPQEEKMRMTTGLTTLANTLMRPCATYAYPHFQHPYAPVSWGTAAYPHTIESMVAMWAITAEDEYLRYMTHSADFSLGLNPLNLSWTTGLGDRPVYGTAHLFGWHTFQGVIPPGLQVEGPNRDVDYIRRFMNENVPDPAETPQYYNYYDVRYSIGLNEGLSKNQAWTAFLYGALLPDLE